MVIIYLTRDGYKLSWDNGDEFHYHDTFSDLRDAVNYCIDHNYEYEIA